MTTTAKIFEGYSMDYTARFHFAQRADGQWFKRSQVKDPHFGYKWSKWREIAEAGVPERKSETGRTARLPKPTPKHPEPEPRFHDCGRKYIPSNATYCWFCHCG
jgi:hypothetical protein